jgi:hypothetical protein
MREQIRETFRRLSMQLWAEIAALHANEHLFESHWGSYPMDCAELDEDGDDGKVLVVYDNHPYSAGTEYRDRQLCRLRQRLDQRGYGEVGFASYPSEGAAEGYSFALLVYDWTPQMQEEIGGIYQEEILRTMHEMTEK